MSNLLYMTNIDANTDIDKKQLKTGKKVVTDLNVTLNAKTILQEQKKIEDKDDN